MGRTTRCRSERRFQDELEISPRLHLPTLLPGATLFGQNLLGEGDRNFSLPVLAEPILVPRPSGTSGGSSASTVASPESSEIQRRSSAPSTGGRIAFPKRVEALRSSFRVDGIPQEVAALLLAGNRSNTSAAYQSAWVGWNRWCMERNKDPMEGDMISILSYLENLYSSGKKYSTINVHRSMLASKNN